MENEARFPGAVDAGPAREQPVALAPKPGVKSGAAPVLPAAKPFAGADPDKNIVFTTLVRGDTDIAGLVAYSIYKQNKLDWLQAFEAAKSRAPDDAEMSAYIIGESTARRLATYRHLAEATLGGQGPGLETGGSQRLWDKKPGAGKGLSSPAFIAIGAVIVILAAAAIWLVAHLAGR